MTNMFEFFCSLCTIVECGNSVSNHSQRIALHQHDGQMTCDIETIHHRHQNHKKNYGKTTADELLANLLT